MGVLQDILEWSTERPLWQRDALRRIVTQGELNNADIDELYRICLGAQNLTDGDHPVPDDVPLAAEHLPDPTRANQRVELIGIREVRGVNALAGDQRVGFEPAGLTVVFGYNGSGKSGYARILRAVCRARERGDQILPNAFAEGDQPQASATIDFRVAGGDQTEAWAQGRESCPDLQHISFFDADCAAVHVDDANDVAFTPFGLDVLPKLAATCLRLAARINDEVSRQSQLKPAALVEPAAAVGTTVRRCIDGLVPTSDFEELCTAATLTQEEEDRLRELQGLLHSDPNARMSELGASSSRLLALKRQIETVASALSEEAIEAIRLRHEEWTTKRQTARVAAEQAFGNQPLRGVGEEVWLALWEAARKYSQEVAFPDSTFPAIGAAALCVLCQQPLGDQARGRFEAFEQFIQSTTRADADAAKLQLAERLGPLDNVRATRAGLDQALLDVPPGSIELRNSLRRFLGIAWRVRRGVVRTCASDGWVAPCTLPEAPLAELQSLIDSQHREMGDLSLLAHDDQRRTLEHEAAELQARRWMGTVLGDVEQEIERLRTLAHLSAAKATTVTTGVTRKSSELTDTYVTGVLRERFQSEVAAIGAGYLQIALNSVGGQYGSEKYRVEFERAQQGITVGRVLSEGEFRAVALAGFLAELSTTQSESAIVFDDPVSSLDHNWRRRIAERLAAEASTRQVIIFTHDIVFMQELSDALDAACPRQFSHLQRRPSASGVCLDGVPWVALPVSRRVGVLRDRLQQARALFNRGEHDAYEAMGREIYGLLREAWERAVEELLLNKVVVRYGREVQTQRLDKVLDIGQQDIDVIETAMTKASRFLCGHDQPEAVNETIPEPDEIRQDIEALNDWVTQMKRRRN